MKGDKASRLLNELVRDTFSMKMTDVADSESVKEHIAKTLDKLSSVSEYAASNQSAELSNVASRMSNNMEFLNSMNQFMAAVQVPIKISVSTVMASCMSIAGISRSVARMTRLRRFFILIWSTLGHLTYM